MKIVRITISFILGVSFAPSTLADDESTAEIYGSAYYKAALQGKFDESLQLLDKIESPSTDQKVFKALCLFGAGRKEEAEKFVYSISPHFPHFSDDSPFQFSARVLIGGAPVVDGVPIVNLKDLIVGGGVIEISSKPDGPRDEYELQFQKPDGTFERKLRLNATKSHTAAPSAGTYRIIYFKRYEDSPKSKSPVNPDKLFNGVEVARFTTKPWARTPVVIDPKIQYIEIINPDTMDAEKAAFQVKGPPGIKFEISVAECPKSDDFPAPDMVEIWAQSSHTPALVQFNDDGKARRPIKPGTRYMVKVNWPAEGEEPGTTHFIFRFFAAK